MGKLTVKFIQQLNDPGRYSDGHGLYLHVRKGGSKQWLLRSTVRKRRVDIGLGSATLFSLAEAREKSRILLKAIKEGRDPLQERRVSEGLPTFSEAAQIVWERKKPTWKSPIHTQQWIQGMRDYAFPEIGNLRIDEISSAHILRVLSPIWIDKHETARRMKHRMSTVFDWAQVSGYRDKGNPVDGVQQALPKVKRSHKHHSALSWQELPAFMEELRSRQANSARALEVIILTAARSGEVRHARWSEFDLKKQLWTIPASRMKMGREHRVPLSEKVIATLRRVEGLDSELIIPSNRAGKSLSDSVFKALMLRMGYDDITTHGFRSTFKDWCSEFAQADFEVSEAALAHVIGDATERAYARSDLLDRRRELMTKWASFVYSAGGA